MIADTLHAVGQQLDIYHANRLTSTVFWIGNDNGGVRYHLQLPEFNGMTAEFIDGASLVAFLMDVNAGLDPAKSALARQELETLKADQILRDAKIAALEKNIVDMPESQVITNAIAEADRIRAAAKESLAKLAEAQAYFEADAVAKMADVAAAEAVATPEELVKAEELKNATA